MTASAGTWSGGVTSYVYQWRRCDAAGGACANLVGATSSSYVLGARDVGFTIRAAVTALNAAGSATAFSAATAAVEGAALPAPPLPPQAGTTTFTFTGALNKKTSARTFVVNGGAGTWSASLSFAKCSTLTVLLRRPDGTVAASATGSSAVTLTGTAAGTNEYEVQGGGQCSFALTVTVPSS